MTTSAVSRHLEFLMHFTQRYLDGLSQASYLIGDETTGQAVVVDPHPDIAEYLADDPYHGLRIIGVINTQCCRTATLSTPAAHRH